MVQEGPFLIEVKSDPDTTPIVECRDCREPTEVRQIGYRLPVQGRVFAVLDVWASVCDVDGRTYFNVEVGDTVHQAIGNEVYEVHKESLELENI